MAFSSQTFTVSPLTMSLPASISVSNLPNIGSSYLITSTPVSFNYTDSTPSNVSSYLICGNGTPTFLANGNIVTNNPDYNLQLYIGGQKITSCVNNNMAGHFYGPHVGSNISVNKTVAVYLVRVANTSSTTSISFPSSLTFCAQGTSNINACFLPVTFRVLGSSSIILPTCTVTTASVGVNLGNVSNSVFSGIGAVSSAVPFNIGLNCPMSNIPLSITISSQVVSGYPNIIKTTSGVGYANNIGVQLLYNGASFPLNTLYRLGGSVLGNNNIPLSGQMYQVGSGVTPGNVNATATFIMTYN